MDETRDPLADAMPAGAEPTTTLLLPYQKRWLADPSPFKVWEKSRRIGATWAEAADDVLIAASDASAGGQNVYYIGTDKEMTEEYIETCAGWAKGFNRAASAIDEGFWQEADEDRHIKTYTIRFPGSGHKIVAMASRPRKLRGRQGILVGDEAAFQDDLEALLEAAMAFLIWGGKVRLLSSHFGATNPFATLISDIHAGKQKGTVHRTTFREAVAQGLYRRVSQRQRQPWTPEAEAAWVEEIYGYYQGRSDQELDCIPSQSAGAYLPLALIESRMVPATIVEPGQTLSGRADIAPPIVIRGRWDDAFGQLPEDVRRYAVDGWIGENISPALAAIPQDEVYSVGGDFGRTQDLSVYVALGEDRSMIRRPRIMVELANCPFRAQEQIYCALVDGLRRRRGQALDAGGNGAALAEAAAGRYGALAVEQVKFSDSYYLQHMPAFKAALQDATLCDLARDAQHRDDLRALRVIDGVPKLPRTKTQSGNGKQTRHGDYAIALFLAHRAQTLESGEIDWTPAPRARDDDVDDDVPWEGGDVLQLPRKSAY